MVGVQSRTFGLDPAPFSPNPGKLSVSGLLLKPQASDLAPAASCWRTGAGLGLTYKRQEEQQSPVTCVRQEDGTRLTPPVSQALPLLCKQPNGQTPPARLRQMERGGRLRVCRAGQRSCALQLRLMKLI